MQGNFTIFTRATIAIFLFLQITFSAQAQFKVNQVLVASGGQFGDPNNFVRIGSYDPQTKIYTVFDSVQAASTKTIITDGNFAYLTADTILVKYNIDALTREAISPKSTTGLSYLASYKNYIIATRGYGAANDFVKVYNKSDLSEAFTISGISDEAAGIVVVGDTAYVAVPGPYNKETGSLAVIDLVNMQLKREIMFDTLGAQIGRIFTDGTNIYTVNPKWNVISTYQIASGNLSHKVGYISYPSAAGVALHAGKVYMDFGFTGIGFYNAVSDTFSKNKVVDYTKIAGFSEFKNFVSGSALDTLNDIFYVSATNFSTTGETYLFNMNGEIIDTFSTGVSPEAIAIDYRSTVGIKEKFAKNMVIIAYPNPVKNALNIRSKKLENAKISITDLSGKIVLQFQQSGKENIKLEVNNLKPGMYLLNIISEKGTGFTKFIKE